MCIRDSTASNARYEGLQKALEEYPNIEVVADDTANWNTDEALALVETWLTQYPDVGGIWCATVSYTHLPPRPKRAPRPGCPAAPVGGPPPAAE